jgi:hypothetical protein
VIILKAKNTINKIQYIVIITLTVLILVSGCGKKQEKPQPPEMNEKVKALMDIDEKIEDITKDVEGIQKEKEKPEEKEEQKQEENKQEKGNEGQVGLKQDQQAINIIEEGDKKEGKQQSKEEKIKGMWEKVNNSIKSIHSTWNTYETNATADGVEPENIQRFEEALNALTIAGEQENDIQCLMQANMMTYYIGNLFEFYEDKGQSEMMKTKHYIRQTYIMAEADDWKKAGESIKKSKPVANRLKQRLKLDKNGQNVFNKLKISLDDMESVLKEKNKELLKIKRDIALKNLEALKEASK